MALLVNHGALRAWPGLTSYIITPCFPAKVSFVAVLVFWYPICTKHHIQSCFQTTQVVRAHQATAHWSWCTTYFLIPWPQYHCFLGASSESPTSDYTGFGTPCIRAGHRNYKVFHINFSSVGFTDFQGVHSCFPTDAGHRPNCANFSDTTSIQL